MTEYTGSSNAYLTGPILIDDNQSAYLKGSTDTIPEQVSAYLIGGDSLDDSTPAYLAGVILETDAVSAYTCGTGTVSSTIRAYIGGAVERGSVSAYLEGESVANDYITLTTSDASVSKKFRVLQEGYDDGTLEKAESRRRTLGGGLDHSTGAIYMSWQPIIRVRHTESESGFGNLEDLKYFYSLNKPTGTPSNIITFTDHHGVEYQVRFFGPFRKALLTTAIEGSQALATVALRLERVTNE